MKLRAKQMQVKWFECATFNAYQIQILVSALLRLIEHLIDPSAFVQSIVIEFDQSNSI
jgi:hypothetical protein